MSSLYIYSWPSYRELMGSKYIFYWLAACYMIQCTERNSPPEPLWSHTRIVTTREVYEPAEERDMPGSICIRHTHTEESHRYESNLG